jgi:uncharacterized lipoprotein YddW (UPF0748 family)
MCSKATILAVLAALAFAQSARAADYVPARIEAPYIQREFRGVWIATVANLDWPSVPGLPVADQKRELIAMLDMAARLNLNAVIFQVSSVCDAMFESKLAPWSYYLTGTMGKAPAPYYDPLRFAIDEAHKRGLELHAWFSPYRAGHPSLKQQPIAPNHISRVRPDLIRTYGTWPWLDPGERDVQNYAINLVMEVVNGYDIDGVHFDDRMGYPYEPDLRIEFNDQATYSRYKSGGGTLSRDEWRRDNVNTLVQRVYESIKAAKPWVKFGIAPAGIWQPGYPPQIKGQNNYAKLYTDSRKWLMEGWVDYLSPQLYWPVKQTEQSFPVLFRWWLDQNPKHRNIWPGQTLEKVATWKPQEIVDQINQTRSIRPGSSGTVLFRAKYLKDNSAGVTSLLMKNAFAKPALVPASAWLDKQLPSVPTLTVTNDRTVSWNSATNEQIALWIFQTRTGDQWQTRLLPGSVRGCVLDTSPDVISLKALDRCGVTGNAAILQRVAAQRN